MLYHLSHQGSPPQGERVVNREPPWEELRLSVAANLRCLHREVTRAIHTLTSFSSLSLVSYQDSPVADPIQEPGTTGWNSYQSASWGRQQIGMHMEWTQNGTWSFHVIHWEQGLALRLHSLSPRLPFTNYLVSTLCACSGSRQGPLTYLRTVEQNFRICRRDHSLVGMTAVSPEIISDISETTWKARIFHLESFVTWSETGRVSSWIAVDSLPLSWGEAPRPWKTL